MLLQVDELRTAVKQLLEARQKASLCAAVARWVGWLGRAGRAVPRVPVTAALALLSAKGKCRPVSLQISLQTEALQALGHGYTMTADATDFEAQLAERVERLEASQPR